MASVATASDTSLIYVIEHMETEISPWVRNEYTRMMQDVGAANLMFTNMKPNVNCSNYDDESMSFLSKSKLISETFQEFHDAIDGDPEAPPKAQTPKTKVKPLRSNNRGEQDDEQEKTQKQLQWGVVTDFDTFKKKKKKGGVSTQLDWDRWAEIGKAIGSPAKSKKELMTSFKNRNR